MGGQHKPLSWIVKALTSGMLALSSCGQPANTVEQLTFWTFEVEPERLEVQQQLAEQFEDETG
ncbi:MAG: hypothetical protein AAGF01_04935, partial [Cyanobacteria bacterium P01_G01_bin.38]